MFSSRLGQSAKHLGVVGVGLAGITLGMAALNGIAFHTKHPDPDDQLAIRNGIGYMPSRLQGMASDICDLAARERYVDAVCAYPACSEYGRALRGACSPSAPDLGPLAEESSRLGFVALNAAASSFMYALNATVDPQKLGELNLAAGVIFNDAKERGYLITDPVDYRGESPGEGFIGLTPPNFVRRLDEPTLIFWVLKPAEYEPVRRD